MPTSSSSVNATSLPPSELLAPALLRALSHGRNVGIAVVNDDGHVIASVGVASLYFDSAAWTLANPSFASFVRETTDTTTRYDGVMTFNRGPDVHHSMHGVVVGMDGVLVVLLEPLERITADHVHTLTELVREATIRERESMKERLLAEDRQRLMRRTRDAAVHSSQRDALTGLIARGHGFELLTVAVDSAHREQTPLSVVMFDLDHFKDVNDTYGHPVGDRVLARAGALLTQMCRGQDVAIRYGGEELLAVLPRTDCAGAVAFADRFRLALLADVPEGSPRVTVSAGVAALQAGSDVAAVIEQADVALYAAKGAGRNRVVASERP